MKKFFRFMPVAVALLLASCSSNDDVTVVEPGQNDQLHKVSFEVKGFETEVSPLKSVEDITITKLGYVALANVDGQQSLVVKREMMMPIENNDYNLVINDELPVGDYTIIVYASNELVTEGHDYVYPIPSDSYVYEQIIAHGPNTVQMFLNTYNLTITPESPATISTEVRLARVVGKVEVVVKDAQKMPSAMSTLTARVSGFVPYGLIGSTQKTAYLGAQNEILPEKTDVVAARSSVIANSEYTLSFYMLDNTNYVDYTDGEAVVPTKLTILGNNGFEAVIKNDLKVYKNKVTRLSGYLFDTTNNNPNVTLDTEWDEVSEESFD